MKIRSNAGVILTGSKKMEGDDGYHELLKQIQALRNDISRVEIMVQSLTKEMENVPKIDNTDKNSINCDADEYRMELRRNSINTHSRLTAFNEYINPIAWYHFKNKLGTDMIGLSSTSCISADGMNTLKHAFGFTIPDQSKSICLLISVDKDYYRINKFMGWTDIADLVIDSLFPYYKDIKKSLSVSKIYSQTHIYYQLEMYIDYPADHIMLDAEGIHNAIALINYGIINSIHNRQIADMVKNTKLSDLCTDDC